MNDVIHFPYGKIAFEAYKKAVGGKTFDGRDIPKWDELSEEVMKGWQAAAQAVGEKIIWSLEAE